MKLFKLTTAALALVAFASCSNNDFIGSNNEKVKNGMVVTVEELESEFGPTTRAASYPTANAEKDWAANKFIFTDGDLARVYDANMQFYNTYEYDELTNIFSLKSSTYSLKSAPAFFLFPGDKVSKAYWDEELGTVAEFKIPQVIEYTADSEFYTEDGMAYASLLPKAGTAAENTEYGEHGVEAEAYSLTAALKVTITEAMGNANWLAVSSANFPLSGSMMAKVDPTKTDNVIELAPERLELQNNKTIFVNLKSVPSSVSVIYLPIMAGADDVKVFLDKNTTTTKGYTNANVTGATLVDGTDWELLWDAAESGYTFVRNRTKALATQKELYVSTPSQLSEILDQYSETTAPVELTLKTNFDLTQTLGGGAVKDITTYVPAMATENVTIKMTQDVTNATSPASPETFTIQDADAEKPFTKSITIDVAGVLSSKMPLVINLPKADVILKGDFANDAANTISVTAKSLTIGDAAEATVATETNAITIPSDVTIMQVKGSAAKPTVVNAITINDASKLTKLEIGGNTTITTAVTTTGAKKTAEIDVIGKITTDLTSNFAKVVMTGTETTAAQIGGDVDAKGQVEIDLTKTAEAIGGTLTFKSTSETETDNMLVLKNGFVNVITCDLTATGSAANKTVNVKIDDAASGKFTAIKTVTQPGTPATAGKIVLTSSTLSGAIPATTENPLKSTIKAYIDGTNKYVYTAAQLAAQMGETAPSAAITLNIKNSLNLNNVALLGINGTGKAVTVQGENDANGNALYTISNLDLSSADAWKAKGVGFVATATIATVKDLNFENVKFQKTWTVQTSSNESKTNTFRATCIGALVGADAGASVINNVNVTLAGDYFGYATTAATKSVISKNSALAADAEENDATNIGGLIGSCAGADLDKASVTGAAINGSFNIGGLIGKTTAAVTIDETTSNITALNTIFETPRTGNDMRYAQVSGGIGFVDATAAADLVTVDAAGTYTSAVNGASKFTTGFTSEAKFFTSDNATPANFFSYNVNQKWVGYSWANTTGSVAALVVKTSGTATTSYVIPADVKAQTETKNSAGTDLAANTKHIYWYTAK